MNSTTSKVYPAITAVTAALAKEGISKSKTNSASFGGGYKFRGIDDVYNALAALLAEHQLAILPRVLNRECVERTSKKGGAMFYVVLEVEYDFVSAEDGSKHTIKVFGEAMDSSDKATNKAMSAAYKYAAIQTFCIPTEGDMDADAHTPEISPTGQQYSAEQFTKNMPEWQRLVAAGKATPEFIVAGINHKGYLLSDAQLEQIYALKTEAAA